MAITLSAALLARGRPLPYLILSDRQTAGVGPVPDSATVEMAEFYVKPEWRHTGAGATGRPRLVHAAPGGWSLSVSPDNPRGLAFWRAVIPAGATTEPLSAPDAIMQLRFHPRRAERHITFILLWQGKPIRSLLLSLS